MTKLLVIFSLVGLAMLVAAGPKPNQQHHQQDAHDDVGGKASQRNHAGKSMSQQQSFGRPGGNAKAQSSRGNQQADYQNYMKKGQEARSFQAGNQQQSSSFAKKFNGVPHVNVHNEERHDEKDHHDDHHHHKCAMSELMKPLMKMVSWSKDQLGPNGHHPGFKQAFGCLNETQQMGVKYLIEEHCKNETDKLEATWASKHAEHVALKAKHQQEKGHSSEEEDDDDEAHEEMVKRTHHHELRRQKHMMRCFLSNAIAKNVNNTFLVDMQKLDEDIEGLTLNATQKTNTKAALHHCLAHNHMNSTQLKDVIKQMTHDGHMMTLLVANLIDSLNENKTLISDIHALKDIKEFLPIVNAMVCFTQSVANNGCMKNEPVTKQGSVKMQSNAY